MPDSSPATIVFLHGFAESQAIWMDFIREFSTDHPLLTPDLLGHGTNTAAVPDYSMEAQARYVAGQLQQQGVAKALLVGHSMGGYVALALAELYPELVVGLVLFHSTALPDTDEKKVNRNKNLDFVRRHGVEKFMESFTRPLFAPANQGRMAAQQLFLEAIGKATSEATVLGAIQAMRDRPDRTQVLRAAAFPCSLSEQRRRGRTFGKLNAAAGVAAESHALLLSNVGHLGYLEAPAVTRRAVADFTAAYWKPDPCPRRNPIQRLLSVFER